MWSRRAQEYDQKINSGKIYELAEVVKDLNKNTDIIADQSYSERQLFEKAYERLKSEFEAVSPLGTDDVKIKEIWSKQYPLKPFLETSNFKSYDDLKEKLNRVIAGSKNTETASEIDLPPSTGNAVKTASVQSNEASKSVGDEDDTLSYFSKLAEDE